MLVLFWPQVGRRCIQTTSSSDFVKILSPAQPAEGIGTPVELFLLVVFFFFFPCISRVIIIILFFLKKALYSEYLDPGSCVSKTVWLEGMEVRWGAE